MSKGTFRGTTQLTLMTNIQFCQTLIQGFSRRDKARQPIIALGKAPKAQLVEITAPFFSKLANDI